MVGGQAGRAGRQGRGHRQGTGGGGLGHTLATGVAVLELRGGKEGGSQAERLGGREWRREEYSGREREREREKPS